MDEIDRKLLDTLQSDASKPLHQLGEIVGLSAAAVQRRIAKHKRSGVLNRLVYVLDRRKSGAPVTVITLVTLERDSPAQTSQLLAALSASPNVLQLHELAGERDLAIYSAFRHLDDYAAVVVALLEGDENVQRFATHVSMRTHKSTLALPLA